MTPAVLVACAAVGGGVGSVSRHLAPAALARTRAHPTVVVNVVGSVLLGLVATLARGGALGAWAMPLLGAGVCGGLTTFSTASLDTVRHTPSARALAYGLGTLLACVLGAGVGVLLAWAIGRAGLMHLEGVFA